MLHEIKHDGVKFKQVLSDIFKVCTEALELGCPIFWDRDIYYSFQSGEEKAIKVALQTMILIFYLICRVKNDNLLQLLL